MHCLGRRLARRQPDGAHRGAFLYPDLSRQGAPWQVGIVFGDDRRLADILIRGLRADPALTVGINAPYSPGDQVYYTVERHAHARGLPAAMIEIRNDEIGDRAGQRRWADRIAGILAAATPDLLAENHAVV